MVNVVNHDNSKQPTAHTTTHFEFCDGHLLLLIIELLNPCRFTHLVIKDISLQSLVKHIHNQSTIFGPQDSRTFFCYLPSIESKWNKFM
jgi:hypothetical protein